MWRARCLQLAPGRGNRRPGRARDGNDSIRLEAKGWRQTLDPVLSVGQMTGSRDLQERLADIAKHTVATLACLVSIWLVHFVLKKLLGPDWKFFDVVPIRYAIDAGELTVLGKLVWHLFKEFD